jgi:hypothetical protein
MGMGGQRMSGARSGHDAAGTSHGQAARDNTPASPRTLELPLARSSALQARPDWRKHARAARNARSPSCAAASASCESSRRAVASSTAVGRGGRPAAPVGRRAGHFIRPDGVTAAGGIGLRAFRACMRERAGVGGTGSRRPGASAAVPRGPRLRTAAAPARVEPGSEWNGGVRPPIHSRMHWGCSTAMQFTRLGIDPAAIGGTLKRDPRMNALFSPGGWSRREPDELPGTAGAVL